MSVSTLHLLRQGPVLRSLAGTVLRSVRSGKSSGPLSEIPGPEVPGPELRSTVPARNAGLVRAYLRQSGADASWYRGQLPPHLFPQWGFPILSDCLGGVPYDLTRLLNAGCRMELRAPLPANQPLQLRAQLMELDDDGRRVIFKQRLCTGTAEEPEALVCHITAILPLPREKGSGKGTRKGGAKKEKPRVPEGARELAQLRLGPRAGRDFALLTGDINPIHWLAPYARMAGFRTIILHGYALQARVVEGLNRQLLSGEVRRLASLEVRFLRPLLLPARTGLFICGDKGGRAGEDGGKMEVFVGRAPGAPAALSGRFELREGATP